MKLCFHLISLIGHGYWIVAENRPEFADKCDTKCGAIVFAEHDRSACVNDMRFKTWNQATSSWSVGRLPLRLPRLPNR